MSAKLFVGNLSFDLTENDLKRACLQRFGFLSPAALKSTGFAAGPGTDTQEPPLCSNLPNRPITRQVVTNCGADWKAVYRPARVRRACVTSPRTTWAVEKF